MNQRQELFCLGVIEGKTARQAYIDAGYAPKAAHVCSSQLLAKPSIQNRIQELRVQTTTKRILDAIQIKEKLSEIISQGEHKDAVKAADILNRMLGTYAPTQTRSQIDQRIAVAAQITVVSPQAQSLVERVLNGERTDRVLPESALSVVGATVHPPVLEAHTPTHTETPSRESQVERELDPAKHDTSHDPVI